MKKNGRKGYRKFVIKISSLSIFMTSELGGTTLMSISYIVEYLHSLLCDSEVYL